MLAAPADVAFKIFSFPVHYYGIIMAIAMVCGILLSVIICKKYFPELDSEEIYNASPFVILSAVLVARLYYCALCHSYYAQFPAEIFQIWHGGLSLHGGILGGLIAGIIYAKIHSLHLAKYCDVFSFGILLGQIIGRWGNFFNSEAFGTPCSSDYFLKLYIPLAKRPLEYSQYQFFHPTFLYEILLNIIVLCILFFALKYKAKLKPGSIFCIYLMLYSVVRIIVEQIRIDSATYFMGLPVAQLVSLVIIAVCSIFLILLTAKN